MTRQESSTMKQPIISGHAEDRWDERMPSTAAGIESAWQRGIPVDHVVSYFEDEEGNVADRVRVYRAVTCTGTEYSALLIARDGVLRTAYQYDGVADSRVEAYLNTMYDRTVYYE